MSTKTTDDSPTGTLPVTRPLGSPADTRQRKFERINELVGDLLAQIKQENPPDPVSFLTQQLQGPRFDVSMSSEDRQESFRSPNFEKELQEAALTIVVLGASGDLAKKKTFPALFSLFRNGLLPPTTTIVGYARSELSADALRERVTPYLPKHCDADIAAFFKLISYVAGPYDGTEGFVKLNKHLESLECDINNLESCKGGNRIFYLALPPTAFVGACKGIRQAAMPKKGWVRVVVEKPFGKDTESSNKLAEDLQALFKEEQIFRIDHYLGKEMVQNLVTLRFANHVFGAVWSNRHIRNVQITFKETIGTQGRGGYFDEFGIIRDVIQNHLTQILALVAMDKPRALTSEAIRDEKVAVLRRVKPVLLENCVLGQYSASEDGKEPGYLDDETVSKGSNSPTFAAMALFVHNDRWDGVPFIIKAGKAMNEKVVSIRIQFRDEIEPFGDIAGRNELVIRAQPDEAMYLKIAAKAPGLNQDVVMTELDLTYRKRYDDVRLPDAYESLINEVISGNSTNFVRSDELDAAWRIFTPVLHKIDAGELKPSKYPFGTRGPEAADELAARMGYRRSQDYNWKAPTS